MNAAECGRELWLIILGGDVEEARVLLEKNRACLSEVLQYRDPETGGSVLHGCVTPLEDDPRRAEIATEILRAEAASCSSQGRARVLDMVKWLDNEGRAIVHCLAEVGDVNMARALLQHKQEHPEWKLDFNALSSRGWPALHHAAAAGQADVVMLLLRQDVPLSRVGAGGTALDVVNNCLDGEDGDGQEDGRTWRLREVQSMLTAVTAIRLAAVWSRKQEARERKEGEKAAAAASGDVAGGSNLHRARGAKAPSLPAVAGSRRGQGGKGRR